MPSTDHPSSRILIIDDEPEIAELLIKLLRNDYECSWANSAEEGLSLISTKEFDLVLTDIRMSGMSGLEFVSKALGQMPDMVAIMISGLHDIESAITAMQIGAFDYITKPFALIQVEAAVKRALEHHRLILAKRHYEIYLEELVHLRTKDLKGALDSVEDSYRASLKALARALEARDQDTLGHSERVVAFSLRLGRELGLNRAEMTSLEYGALLHDIGKIGTPDSILRKPAKLTADEWTQMRLHPQHGAHILNGIKFLEGASRVVVQHHEKWDGSGYPLGLKGEDIDLNARIFAVADAFDAIISDRVYRAGKSCEQAAAELDLCAGKHFDPHVIEAFHRVSIEEWKDLRRPSSEVSEGFTGDKISACQPPPCGAMSEEPGQPSTQLNPLDTTLHTSTRSLAAV